MLQGVLLASWMEAHSLFHLGAAACAVLVLACLIWWDVREMVLPDSLVAAFACIGAVVVLVEPIGRQTALDSVIGAALFAGVFWAYRVVLGRLLGDEALGLGDVKFAAAAGVWLGWAALPLFMVLGVLFGLAVRGCLMVGWQRPADVSEHAFPLGPGLCLAVGALALAMAAGWPVGLLDPEIAGQAVAAVSRVF